MIPHRKPVAYASGVWDLQPLRAFFPINPGQCPEPYTQFLMLVAFGPRQGSQPLARRRQTPRLAKRKSGTPEAVPAIARSQACRDVRILLRPAGVEFIHYLREVCAPASLRRLANGC